MDRFGSVYNGMEDWVKLWDGFSEEFWVLVYFDGQRYLLRILLFLMGRVRIHQTWQGTVRWGYYYYYYYFLHRCARGRAGPSTSLYTKETVPCKPDKNLCPLHRSCCL